MSSLPIRGSAVRSLALPLPPRRMPLVRDRRPLKRWSYVGVYGPELMLCVGDARVAGLRQRWWAVALPDGRLYEGHRRVRLEPGRVRVAGVLDLTLGEAAEVEVVSPHGRSFIWTRKRAGVPVRGLVRADGRELSVEGPLGFVDESAGYHARQTAWRWSAGIGRAVGGQAVAWNLVDGVHDAPVASERTVWVDGEPREVGPVEFAADLSQVRQRGAAKVSQTGELSAADVSQVGDLSAADVSQIGDLRFSEWAAREDHTKRLVFRSDYRQPFGSFSGTLPGGLELESGYGVMEWHDVRW